MMGVERFARWLDQVAPDELRVVAAQTWEEYKKPDRMAIVRALPNLGATHEGAFSRPVYRVQNRSEPRKPDQAEDDGFAMARAVLAAESQEFEGLWITSFSVSGWPTPLPTSPDDSRRSMLESSYMVQVSTELAGT